MSLTNTIGPIQYRDPQYLEIFSTVNKSKSSDILGFRIILEEIYSGSPQDVDLLSSIVKGKGMIILGTPLKYEEMYTGINF